MHLNLVIQRAKNEGHYYRKDMDAFREGSKIVHVKIYLSTKRNLHANKNIHKIKHQSHLHEINSM